MHFIHAFHSCISFMHFIHAFHSCISFMHFIHAFVVFVALCSLHCVRSFNYIYLLFECKTY